VLELRPATADDLALCHAITEEAMRGYVEQTWDHWDADAQWRKHCDNYTPASHRIVMVDGAAAGLLAVEQWPDHLWLVKLYLRAAQRGQGIGSGLLRDVVLPQAQALRLPVRLRVLRVNLRAQALYARHGFRVVGETAERLFMERAAD
jgi:ribosomal protein S18 acetylase RimI-like enzyme